MSLALTPRLIMALLLVALGLLSGCRGAPTWRIRFLAQTDRDTTRRIEARVREGGCDGAIVFETSLSREDPGMPAPALAPGAYGVEALAIDASCQLVARGCVLVTLPTGAPVVVDLESTAPTARCAPSACVDGRCVEGNDAGSTDAGGPDARDAGTLLDAPALDSGVDASLAPDATTSMDAALPIDAPDASLAPDAYVGPDAWAPAPPAVIAPWNGLTTGTWRDVAGDVTDPPRRPLVRWEPSSGALSYVLELVACDAHDLALCDFSAPASRVVVDDLTFTARPTTSLDVAAVTPGGRRYAFRVGACSTATGDACAFSAPRYIDVGRHRQDLDGDGDDEIVLTQASGVIAQGGTGLSASPTTTIAMGATYGAVAYAGDVDADGRSDVAVSAGGPTGRWELRRFDGSLLGAEDGTAAADRLASVLAGVGDVDGDGYADVAIGAPGIDELRIQLGGASFDAARRIVLHGDPTLETFGIDVAAAGDRDGDGLADVVVVSRASAGMVRVEIFSLASGAARVLESVELPSGETDPSATPFPAVVEGGHDLDGDGRPEIILGFELRNEGIIWEGTGARSVFTSMGQMGHAFAMGDLAGNGIERVVFGAPTYNWGGGVTGAYGHLSYFGSANLTIISVINRESWGTHVASADLDGDGRDDMFNVGANDVGHLGRFSMGMVGASVDFRIIPGGGVRDVAH